MIVARNGFDRNFWYQILVPAVLKRDSNECQKCCAKENLDVAHKKYGLDVTIGDLITLCRSCHKVYDKEFNIYIDTEIPETIRRE